MVVLEHEHFGQIHAVVASTADAHGILFQIALPGEGFASIQQANPRALQLVNIAPGQICDAAKVCD